MEDCLFCKIVKGEIPSCKIYEDEYTYAFLDISNDAEGHTLVVPKNHAVNITEAQNDDIAHVLNTVKKISHHFIKNCGFEGVNIFNNCNESAGQTIMHLHFHIIPRKNGDGINSWVINGKSNNSLEEICEVLRMF